MMGKKQILIDEYNHPKNLHKCDICGHLVKINEVNDKFDEKHSRIICEDCQKKIDNEARCQIILG